MRSIGLAYPMSTTGVVESVRRNSAPIASTSRNPTLCLSARSEERWITGPSAMGSENGTPSSITSAPFFASACITATVCRGLGSPAVTEGMSAERRAARSFSNVAGMRLKRFLECDSRGLAHGMHVLVAAPREVHEQNLVAAHRGRELHGVGDRMARLERGNDSFEAAQRMEGFQRLVVRHRHVLRAPRVLEPRVLGAYAGIVEAGGDRMCLLDLAVGVLHEVGAGAVEHSRRSGRKRARL